MGKQTRTIRYDFRGATPSAAKRFHQHILADLDAGADLASTVIFVPGEDVTIHDVTVTPDGTAAGVDDSNTSVWTVKNGANTLVTETFDSSTAFPADNTKTSLGTLDSDYTLVKDGGRLELAVTNGATANLPACVVTIEYSTVRDDLAGVAPDWQFYRSAAAGNPTVSVSGGKLQLALDATEEAQILTAFLGDHLAYDIDDIIRMEMLVSISDSSLDSAITVAMGLASARNDDTDLLAANALFKLAGSNSLVCESDDGTNDNDDKDAAETLSTTIKRLAIDFATGLVSVSPPSLSRGGKGNVLFFADNDNGSLRAVARNTAFDMSNYSAGLQPFFQIQKSSDTGLATLSIQEVTIEVKA